MRKHLTILYLAAAITVVTVAPALAKKPSKPGGGSTSDHIPVKITLRDNAADGIRSDNGNPYVNGELGVICDLNTPGSLICNSTDFKKRTGLRSLTFELGGSGGLNQVTAPFTMTTTFCTVRDLLYMEKDEDCHLNLRFDYAGTNYALRFDPSIDGSTPVTSECTDQTAAAEGDVCKSSLITADGPANPTAALFQAGRGGKLSLVGLVPMTTEITIEVLP